MTHHLPASFKIPKGYRREFRLAVPERDLRLSIVADETGLSLTQDIGGQDRTTKLEESKVLDWIAESVMAVRCEVGEGV